MKLFKYLRNSTIIIKINLNPFVDDNHFFPKFVHVKPQMPFDLYRHTFAVVMPLLQIFVDIDCESSADKYNAQLEAYKSILPDEGLDLIKDEA